MMVFLKGQKVAVIALKSLFLQAQSARPQTRKTQGDPVLYL